MKESDKNKKEMAVLEDSQQQIAFEVEDYLKKNYLLRYNMMTRMEECCKITSENDEKNTTKCSLATTFRPPAEHHST